MSGTNHIVGGTVFTGIFVSFWNTNIFEKPEYLFFAALFAILPDVDHVKSPIGKAFYPIAKWLNVKYGHRTITHSLIFYLSLLFLVAFVESIFSTSLTITLIYSFAYFSHLLFDMLTKQGIPLFYPFKRNPCVIPGNPELRLKSSDFKTESLCFGIFILLGITCQNLFAQGFWSTYNKQFNDLKHLFQESRMSDNTLSVQYDFKTTNGREVKGKGLLIKSTEGEAILFSNGFVKITKDDKIIALQPLRTNLQLVTDDLLFYNISRDSLNSLVKDKAIVSLKIQSTQEFEFVKENQLTVSKNADLSYIFNPAFTFHSDSANAQVKRQLDLLKYELSQTLQEKKLYESARHQLHYRITQLDSSIPEMDLYTREKATKELSELKRKLEAMPEKEFDTHKVNIQISHLQKELDSKSKTLVSGYIQFINFK